MVWSNFPASGPGSLVLTDGIINAALYQTVLRENVWPSVYVLKLKNIWVMQQNNLKTISKYTTWIAQLNKNKMKVLSKSGLKSDCILFCHDLKEHTHKVRPFMPENPPMWLNRNNFAKRVGPHVLHSVLKHLLPVITSAWFWFLLQRVAQPAIRSRG